MQASEGPLWDRYDVALLDLDGVVYVGPDAVPGAVDHLAAAQRRRAAPRVRHQQRLAHAGRRRATTCASSVSTRRDEDVVTSAQAAARMLADRLPAGSAVFLIGGRGLEVALAEVGLRAGAEQGRRPGGRGLGLLRRPALGRP